MWEEDDRRRRLRLLEAAGMAQASQTVLDVAGIAGELDVPEDTIRMDLEQLDALGLVLNGPDEGLSPMLLTAGSSSRTAATPSTRSSASFPA